MNFTPHAYQMTAVKHVLDNIAAGGGSALFLEPGLGKTATTLYSLDAMMLGGEVQQTLIVAPLRVCQTVWKQEGEKWDDFSGLKFHFLHGTKMSVWEDSFLIRTKKDEFQVSSNDYPPRTELPYLNRTYRGEKKTATDRVGWFDIKYEGNAAQAKKVRGAVRDADVFLCTPDGVGRLVHQLDEAGQRGFFDLLVVDESTYFKNWTAKRTKALKKLVDATPRRLILTGTPSPNSIADLFSQLYIVDKGDRLGDTLGKFRARYMQQGGYKGYAWEPKQNAGDAIEQAIGDVCLYQSALDHLDIPEKIVHDVWYELPSGCKRQYDEFEKEMFAELDKHDGSKGELIASSAGAKYNYCRQLANGGFYEGEPGDPDRQPVTTHLSAAEVSKEIHDELNGKPVLIAVGFRHDKLRLDKVFGYDLPVIWGGTASGVTSKLLQQWNDGELPVLCCHPASMGHGLNMQHGPGRDIIWLGGTDSLEQYDQANARIWRQGVSSEVRIHRVLAKGTVHEAIRERLENKSTSQKALLDALKTYRKSKNL